MGLLCWGDFEFSPKIRVCVRPCGGDFHFSCFFPCVCRGPVAETLIFTFFSLCGGPVVGDFEFSRKNPYRVLCPVVETLIFF